MEFEIGDLVEFKTGYMLGQIIGNTYKKFGLYTVRLSTPTGMQLIHEVRDNEIELSAWKKQAPTS